MLARSRPEQAGHRTQVLADFLGLDDIGLFDRTRPLPTEGRLDPADDTAWMGFFRTTLLAMALELAHEDPAYENIASKLFEHFMANVDAEPPGRHGPVERSGWLP